MDNNNEKLALPFITRKMINFSEASRIQVRIRYMSKASARPAVVGATKEGIFKFKFTTLTTDEGETLNFNLSDFPIWIALIDDEEEIKEGQMWASVSLVINGDIMMTYCSGYIYQFKQISWPTSQLEFPSPYKGSIVQNTGANPAAGAEEIYTLNGQQALKINAITFTLVTSAAVANRRVHIVFNPKQSGSFDCISSIDQPASTTRKYHCIPIGTAGVYSDDNDIIIPIPADLILPPESTITTETTNLQAGDDYGVMTIHAERFLTPLN